MNVHEHAFPNSYKETSLVLIPIDNVLLGFTLVLILDACSKHESTVVERLKSMNKYQ